MFWIVVILAIAISVVLIIMVLLQPSKGGGMSGAFGGLGSTLGSTFGARRTLDFLAKGTTWLAGILGILCLLANLAISAGGSSPSGGSNLPVTTGAHAVATPRMGQPAVAPPPGKAQQGQGQQAPANQATPAPTTSQPAQVETHTPDVKVTPMTKEQIEAAQKAQKPAKPH